MDWCCDCGLDFESLEHATAWFAPLPPKPVVKDVAVMVSPAAGMRGVVVMKSMLREPITATVGALDIARSCAIGCACSVESYGAPRT